jgi:hypothetical protein
MPVPCLPLLSAVRDRRSGSSPATPHHALDLAVLLQATRGVNEGPAGRPGPHPERTWWDSR